MRNTSYDVWVRNLQADDKNRRPTDNSSEGHGKGNFKDNPDR